MYMCFFRCNVDDYKINIGLYNKVMLMMIIMIIGVCNWHLNCFTCRLFLHCKYSNNNISDDDDDDDIQVIYDSFNEFFNNTNIVGNFF